MDRVSQAMVERRWVAVVERGGYGGWLVGRQCVVGGEGGTWVVGRHRGGCGCWEGVDIVNTYIQW